MDDDKLLLIRNGSIVFTKVTREICEDLNRYRLQFKDAVITQKAIDYAVDSFQDVEDIELFDIESLMIAFYDGMEAAIKSLEKRGIHEF